jgi:hypothetical protein
MKFQPDATGTRRGQTTDQIRNAVISPDGRFRWVLTRCWDSTRRMLCWIMLNPSTADAEVDDATIRACVQYARAWGYGGIWVVNLYAYRATDPADLVRAGCPAGPCNDDVIAWAVQASGAVMVAWGAVPEAVPRAIEVFDLLEELGVTDIYCLGTTKAGAPRHPLRNSAALPMTPYDPWQHPRPAAPVANLRVLHPPANPDVIDILEGALEDARAGRVTGCLLLTTRCGGGARINYDLRRANLSYLETLGAFTELMIGYSQDAKLTAAEADDL